MLCYLSFIARDWQGQVVLMSISKFDICVPAVAEAKAILAALQTVVARSLTPVIVERSAKLIMDCALQRSLPSAIYWEGEG